MTFYVGNSPYPSSSYYEAKVEASPGSPGVIYVPKPPTQDELGIIFCNIDGDIRNNTNSTIDVGPDTPSKYTQTHRHTDTAGILDRNRAQ